MMKPTQLALKIVFVAIILFATTGFISTKNTPDTEANAQNCADPATLFRSARAVISKNQALINDPVKGDKDLSGAQVQAITKSIYAEATGKTFKLADASTLAGQAQRALFDAVDAVMTQAQPLINMKGKGFKGFLPAVFAKQVADDFSNRMNGKMFIKLTAPKNYVRNRSNRPDDWEYDVIENKFRLPNWEKNQTFAEAGEHKGKAAFRLLIPEYYKESCLGCHGEPKGELDVTGGKKEGGKLGELGGAISVVIYE